MFSWRGRKNGTFLSHNHFFHHCMSWRLLPLTLWSFPFTTFWRGMCRHSWRSSQLQPPPSTRCAWWRSPHFCHNTIGCQFGGCWGVGWSVHPPSSWHYILSSRLRVRWVIWACLSQPPPHWGSTSTCLPFSRCPSHYRCRTMGRPIDKSSHSISGTQLSQAKPKGIWTVAVPVLILHWHQPQVFLVDDELAGGSHPPVTCAPTLCSEYIQFSRTWTEECDLFKGHGPHETGTEVPDVSMALFVPQKPYCGS